MKIIHLNKNASANQLLWSRTVQAIKRICWISLIFLINLTLLGGFNSSSEAAEEISIKFVEQTMSAELQGVSLKMILAKLKKEKGIWVKGNGSSIEDRITTKFEDLSLENGLKRIFININHVLIFDQDKRMIGIYILGKNAAEGGANTPAPNQLFQNHTEDMDKASSNVLHQDFRDPFLENTSASADSRLQPDPFKETEDLFTNPFGKTASPFSEKHR
jgi:hypothetical protein